ncbi:MAG: porin [Betaproteobacteria bacterium]|nr:porin [Betaproteobacteria bacterium]
MKKSLLALAALASVASVAHAEDGVQLYGIIDVGVAQMTNTSDFSPNFVTGAVPTGNLAKAANVGTALGMMNGGQSATRWGIKGSEDLGSGRKVGFTLESGFSVGNGQLASAGLAGSSNLFSAADTSLNGQLFGRQAHLDLSDRQLGSLQIGRVYNLMADVTAGGYDPVDFQMFSPISFSGNYGGGGLTDNYRIDNSLKYIKEYGNYKFKYLHSFGGRSNSYTGGSSDQASLAYENSRFGVSAAYEYSHDVTNLSNPGYLDTSNVFTQPSGISALASPTSGVPIPNAVSVTYYDLRALQLAGKYNINSKFGVKGGYELLAYMPASNYAADSALTQVYGYTVSGQANGGMKNVNVFWLGGNYNVTDRIKLSAGYYYVAQLPGSTAAGTTSQAGASRFASLAAEYYISKRTNLYAAVMNDTVTGSQAAGNNGYVATTGTAQYPTVFNTYGIGVRTKF